MDNDQRASTADEAGFTTAATAEIVGMGTQCLRNRINAGLFDFLLAPGGKAMRRRVAGYTTRDLVAIRVALEISQSAVPLHAAAKLVRMFYDAPRTWRPAGRYICVANYVNLFGFVAVQKLAQLEDPGLWFFSTDAGLRWKIHWILSNGKFSELAPSNVQIPPSRIIVDVEQARAFILTEIEKFRIERAAFAQPRVALEAGA